MLKKSGVIVNKVELKKSKSFGVYEEVKSNVAKKGFHYTGSPKAKSNPKWDNITYNNISNNVIEPSIKTFNYNLEKSKEIQNTIQEANSIALVKNSYNISHRTLKKALEHECFYDVISKNDENVTIIFIPITTSSNKVLCVEYKSLIKYIYLQMV